MESITGNSNQGKTFSGPKHILYTDALWIVKEKNVTLDNGFIVREGHARSVNLPNRTVQRMWSHFERFLPESKREYHLQAIELLGYIIRVGLTLVL